MRQFFDKVTGQWLDAEEYAFRKACNSQQVARSDLPAPMLINDSMEPTQSMVDGKFYTSKAQLRSTYKPSGNKEGRSYVEMGNDPLVTAPPKKPKTDRQGIKASVRKAFSQAGLGA